MLRLSICFCTLNVRTRVCVWLSIFSPSPSPSHSSLKWIKQTNVDIFHFYCFFNCIFLFGILFLFFCCCPVPKCPLLFWLFIFCLCNLNDCVLSIHAQNMPQSVRCAIYSQMTKDERDGHFHWSSGSMICAHQRIELRNQNERRKPTEGEKNPWYENQFVYAWAKNDWLRNEMKWKQMKK